MDHEDGSRLYHEIKLSLKRDKLTIIDFEEVDIVTSSFLNTSFRLLAKDYDKLFLKEGIQIINSNNVINRMIKQCLDETYSLDFY